MIKEKYISRELHEKLTIYQDLLLKWNKKISLISKQDEDKIWERHFYDSLQLLDFINNKNIELLDIGSGAGFPGMVLSFGGVKKVTLVESNEKKAIFLLQVSALSGNEINVVNDRIENIDMEVDIITSRALATLDKIFSLTKRIKVKDKFLLLKGNTYQEELLQAKQNWIFDYKIHDSLTNIGSKVFEITNLKAIS